MMWMEAISLTAITCLLAIALVISLALGWPHANIDSEGYQTVNGIRIKPANHGIDPLRFRSCTKDEKDRIWCIQRND